MIDDRSAPDQARADIRALLSMYQSILDFIGTETSVRFTRRAADAFDLPTRSVHANYLTRDLSRRRMLKTIARLREGYGTRAVASTNANERTDADEIDGLLERFQRSVLPPVSWWKLAIPAALVTTFVFRLLSFTVERDDRPSYEALLESLAASLRLDYQTAFDPATHITGRATSLLVFNLLFSLLLALSLFIWKSYPHYRALFLTEWTSDKVGIGLSRERCAETFELGAAAAVGRRPPSRWDIQIDLVLKITVVAMAFAWLVWQQLLLGGPLSSRLTSIGLIVLVLGPFCWWYVVRASERMAARRALQPKTLDGFLKSLSHSRSLVVWCLMAFALFLASAALEGVDLIFFAIFWFWVIWLWVILLWAAAWVAEVGWPRCKARFQRA